MRKRLPDWFKVKLPNKSFAEVEQDIKSLALNTICLEAKCPNRFDCWERHSATFMILGAVCTRNCRFCNVRTGTPDPIDVAEGERIARIVNKYELEYVVITSVTRDDLPDEGAAHFADVVSTLHNSTRAHIELLIPDFHARRDLLKMVMDAGPTVIGHNIETVRRLSPSIRSKAEYYTSLQTLAQIKNMDKNMLTKSGIMVGLGETDNEVLDALADLRAVNVDIVTIGQYLQPSDKNIEVDRFVSPQIFKKYEDYAYSVGFRKVFSGPLVRSSFHADEAMSLISS